MKGKSLVFFAAVIVVCSCFLKQEPPAGAKNPLSMAPAGGIVVLEELQGVDQQAAGIAAIFAAEDKISREGFEFSRDAGYPTLGYQSIVNTARASCQVKRYPRTDSPREAKIVTGGELEFGPVLQSTMLSIEEDSKHQYYRKLDWGVPAGIFVVHGRGSEWIPKFDAELSLPEALQGVQVGSAAIEDSLTIDKGQPLSISWKSVVIPHSSNVIVIDLSADTAEETVRLTCRGRENELSMQDQANWQIPTSLLSQMPTTNEATLYVVRGHGTLLERTNFSVELQGLRSYLASAVITE